MRASSSLRFGGGFPGLQDRASFASSRGPFGEGCTRLAEGRGSLARAGILVAHGRTSLAEGRVSHGGWPYRSRRGVRPSRPVARPSREGTRLSRSATHLSRGRNVPLSPRAVPVALTTTPVTLRDASVTFTDASLTLRDASVAFRHAPVARRRPSLALGDARVATRRCPRAPLVRPSRAWGRAPRPEWAPRGGGRRAGPPMRAAHPPRSGRAYRTECHRSAGGALRSTR